jgi:hypothetical protein
MYRPKLFLPLLAGLMVMAQPHVFAALPSAGQGLLHVLVLAANGQPAREAMVWVVTHKGGRHRLAAHRTGGEGRATFTVPAGAFTIHARGAGGHSANIGASMTVGQERTMTLTLHGYGGWYRGGWWRRGGLVGHNRNFIGRRLGLRALHRAIVARREARAAARKNTTTSPPLH